MRRFSGSQEDAVIARHLSEASRAIVSALAVARRMRSQRARGVELELARIASALENVGSVSGLMGSDTDSDLKSEDQHAERQRADQARRMVAVKTEVTE